MTRNVTGSCRVSAILAGLALVAGTPLAAQDSDVDEITDAAEEVAKTPLEDLNLAKDEIPPPLARALADPYDDTGYDKCVALEEEIGALDAVLGEDMDTQTPEEREISIEKLAKSIAGSFIPFRGVIREISGANASEEKARLAVISGMMRRAYFKGLGQERGCNYPARPAKS